MKKHNLSLFIFRRDLRVIDNTALNAALKESYVVIPCFIINPEQVGSQNEYRSKHAIQFMIESLAQLSEEIAELSGQLYFFEGRPEIIVASLFTDLPINALYINKDYTPYSFKRDNILERLCKEYSRAFYSYDDALLHPPLTIVTSQNKPYKIFTPFYNKALAREIPYPQALIKGQFC